MLCRSSVPGRGAPQAARVAAGVAEDLSRVAMRLDERGRSLAEQASLEGLDYSFGAYTSTVQRERAEFQNYRRRSDEERLRQAGLAGEDLIRKVLVIADDFDLAIAKRPDGLAGEPWVEGIVAIDRKLRSLLESEGVTAIEGSPGTAFDPRVHEAIANVPTASHPEGAIVDEVRRGYLLRDRVIRPALVAVASGEPKND